MEKTCVSIVHKNKIHEGIFVVNWQYGNQCNYSCQYCTDMARDGSIQWVDINCAQRVVDTICAKNVEEMKKTVYFEFTGGEVTLYKDLIELVTYIRNKKCWTGIISNGSRSLRFWETIRPFLDHICLSFHPHTMKPGHFLSVVQYLSEVVATHINIMMHPEFFDDCEQLGRKIAQEVKNVSICFQPLYVTLSDTRIVDYTEYQRNKITELENTVKASWTRKIKTYRGLMNKLYKNGTLESISVPQLINNEMTDYRGWQCWSGVEQIIIDLAGDIYTSWCRQEKIGNIYDLDFSIPDKPIRCSTKKCFCPIDLLTTKSRENLEKQTLSVENLSTRQIPLDQFIIAAASDEEAGGKSQGTFVQQDGIVKARLDTLTSSLDYQYSLVSLKPDGWKFQKQSDGIILRLSFPIGRILTARFLLHTNTDYDYYECQLLGKEKDDYIIFFKDVKQEGYGQAVPWDSSEIYEIRLVNEYFNNAIDLLIEQVDIIPG